MRIVLALLLSMILLSHGSRGGSLDTAQSGYPPSVNGLIAAFSSKMSVRHSYEIDGLEAFYVHDMDPKNTEDDIFACTRREMLVFMNHDGSFRRERTVTFRREGRPLGIFNMSDVDEPKCLVLVRANGACEIDCYACDDPDDPDTPIYTLRLPGDCRAAASGLALEPATVLGCFDVDDDRSNEIYLDVVTEAAGGGRRHSLLSFEGATGALRWRYDLPGRPTACILDPAIEGKSRIVVCMSSAPMGPDDAGAGGRTTWISTLDGDGFEEQRAEFRSAGARVEIALSHSGETGLPEILVAKCREAGAPSGGPAGGGWIFGKLSPRHDRVIPRDPAPSVPVDMTSRDLDGDGAEEIVTADASGCLSVRDSSFSPLFRSDDDLILQKRILHVGNYDDLPAQEIACLAFDSLLVIRDQRADLVAAREFHSPIEVLPVCTDSLSSTRALAVRNGNRIDIAAVVSAAGNPARGNARNRTLALGVTAVVLLLIVQQTIGARKRSRAIDRNLGFENLLGAMESFQHGRSSIGLLESIGRHLYALRDAGLNPGPGRLAELLEHFESDVSPDLDRIATFAAQAGIPEAEWSKMTPAAEMLRERIRALSVADAVNARDLIRESLEYDDTILGSLDSIRRRLRGYFNVSAEAALTAVLKKRRTDANGRTVPVTRIGGDVAGISAFAAPVVFRKIVDELIANAVTATRKTAEPSIRVSARADGNRCKIDVTDNGCGIAKDDWERIFKRGHTTKEKGGFGLFYAKIEIEKLGGEISVLASEPGSGTTMRAVFRVVEDVPDALGRVQGPQLDHS